MGSAVYFLACARRLREPEQKESIAMIIEVTTLHIHPGQNQAFEAAITQAAQSFIAPFPGCLGYSIRRCIEERSQYVIEIRWKTLEDHMEGFCKSKVFTAWRAAISEHFAQAPGTFHYECLEQYSA